MWGLVDVQSYTGAIVDAYSLYPYFERLISAINVRLSSYKVTNSVADDSG